MHYHDHRYSLGSLWRSKGEVQKTVASTQTTTEVREGGALEAQGKHRRKCKWRWWKYRRIRREWVRPGDTERFRYLYVADIQ